MQQGFIDIREERRPPSPRTPPLRPGEQPPVGGGGCTPEVCGAAEGIRRSAHPGTGFCWNEDLYFFFFRGQAVSKYLKRLGRMALKKSGSVK